MLRTIWLVSMIHGEGKVSQHAFASLADVRASVRITYAGLPTEQKPYEMATNPSRPNVYQWALPDCKPIIMAEQIPLNECVTHF